MHRKAPLAIVVALLGLMATADAGLFRTHPANSQRDSGQSFSSGSRSNGSGNYRKVRTTAYTHTEADHIQYKKKNALGTTLRSSRRYTSAAADWSRYPVGTVFRMKGSRTVYVIDDYGSALVGTGTIDIYHRNKRGMDNWGVRHVEIEILKMGSYKKSREILKDRLHHSHCRQMYVAIMGRSAWGAIAQHFPG